MIAQHFPECFALFICRVQWEYIHAHCPLGRKAFKWGWLFTTANRKQYCFCPQYCWIFGKGSTLVRRAAKHALAEEGKGWEVVQIDWSSLGMMSTSVRLGGLPPASRWSQSVPSYPDDHMSPPLPMPSQCEFCGVNPVFVLQFLRI